jgi:hypothetical protein
MNELQRKFVFNFKTEHIAGQFLLLDARLIKILLDLANYAWIKYKNILTVTELLRTKAEQREIYANNPEFFRKPWPSVHQFGCGADIRTRDIPTGWLKEMSEYINNKYEYDPERPHLQTLRIHSVRGEHMHIQVLPER